MDGSIDNPTIRIRHSTQKKTVIVGEEDDLNWIKNEKKIPERGTTEINIKDLTQSKT
jgi:hypothetical protein